jgi:general secretion pathway protein I
MKQKAYNRISFRPILCTKTRKRIHPSSLIPHPSRKRRGFTLIEMIVATMLLALAVVGALVAFNAATQSASHSERLHTVSLLAQRRLTELELQSDSLTGGDQQGDFAPEYPEYQWHQVVEPTEYQNLYRVALTVRWGAPNAPRERTFVTYIRSDQNQVPQATTGAAGAGGAAGGAGAAGGGANGGTPPTP